MRAVYAGLQAVAPQADIASDDVAERTHTWQLVERARADLEVAEDRSGLRGITPAGHVGAVPVINAREHELAEPLRQLHRAYAQAVREGEVPRARQELLESVLDSFVPKALGRSGSEEELRRSRSKLSEVMRRMVHVIADPSEGGAPLAPDSRAGQIWCELVRLKLAPVDEVNRRFTGREESEAGFELLIRIGRAGTSLYKAREDHELVCQQE
jgi:hypothetical protein